eukprot:1625202-Pleurochrysis_carterae.AAC.6
MTEPTRSASSSSGDAAEPAGAAECDAACDGAEQPNAGAAADGVAAGKHSRSAVVSPALRRNDATLSSPKFSEAPCISYASCNVSAPAVRLAKTKPVCRRRFVTVPQTHTTLPCMRSMLACSRRKCASCESSKYADTLPLAATSRESES